MRALLVSLLLVCGGGLAASRFAPRITRVEVSGNQHLSRAQVLELADVKPGDPFLWVTSFRMRHLMKDPWVRKVRVMRYWPHTVTITVWERQPVLSDGTTAWAQDGTVLPGVTASEAQTLPHLTGWGPPRVDEALTLLRLLHAYGPKVIGYSPEGFEIQLTGTSLFTPSAEALEQQWAAFESHRGGRVAVYPWGVSKAHE
ncbi:MAG: FtsQ-type POTRA domain-containing protein [Deinococcales bacterium]